MLNNVDALIDIKDDQRRFRYANQKVAQVFGRSQAEIAGRLDSELVPQALADPFWQLDQYVFAAGHSQASEESLTGPDGKVRHYGSHKVPLDLASTVKTLIGFSSDISELYDLKEQLRLQSIADALAGLANPRRFFDLAMQAGSTSLRHRRPLTLLMLNLDHFTDVNDLYGDPAGDTALQAFAPLLQDAVRREHIVERVGGEEFAVLLPDTAAAEADGLAERILAAIRAQSYVIGEHELTITASIGVAERHSTDTRFDALYSRSDRLLYEARHLGRAASATPNTADRQYRGHTRCVIRSGQRPRADGHARYAIDTLLAQTRTFTISPPPSTISMAPPNPDPSRHPTATIAPAVSNTSVVRCAAMGASSAPIANSDFSVFDSTVPAQARVDRCNKTAEQALCCTFAPLPASPMSQPPIAPRRPHRLKKHGETRIDDYYWLRERDDPAVLDYLKAENAYAEAALAPLQPLQDTLYSEMKARIQEDDSSVPYRLGNWMYYYRYEVGGQYPLLCRKCWRDEDQWQMEPELLLLDLNALAAGLPYMEVGEFEISPNGQLLAYSTDATGFRQYTLHIKELVSGALLGFAAERVTSAAWALDNRTLFFTTEDAETKRSNQLWRWQLDDAAPVLVREERDERFGVDVYLSRSQCFLICQTGSHTTSEIRVLAADQPLGRWRTLLRRRAGVEYGIEHGHDRFWLRINDKGRNFRLVTVPDQGPIGTPETWHEILPERAGVMLEGVELFSEHMVCHERVNGLSQLVVTQLATCAKHTIAFDEPAYSLSGGANAEWNSRVYRYDYESMTTPGTVYDYDMATRERTLMKRRPVLGDFDPARYATDRIWAAASDGTQVPISLVWRRDTPHPAPLWLEGYGAYGAPNDVYFSSSRLSLLDRGFIYAVAHIRGGGDLGKTWHDAGRLANKHQTFSDFIACAEHLFATDHTTPQQLVIEGGSAGGLLLGAVLNQRPDLCRLAILEVPFVDVLTTMLDPDLPLTVGEYEEWGNPNRREQYGWLRAYSPYDNLAATAYPAMLVRTSLNDSQVMYWEPAKYVAKLRTLKTDANPLLFITNLDAGHGGASGRFDHLRETAVAYSAALGL